MELHERMKRQALAEFESYRQRMEDMQLCTEAQVRAAHACVSSVMRRGAPPPPLSVTVTDVELGGSSPRVKIVILAS